MEIDVFVAGWEIECCQPPPGEGDRSPDVVREVSGVLVGLAVETSAG
jgi:hypothetical protein